MALRGGSRWNAAASLLVAHNASSSLAPRSLGPLFLSQATRISRTVLIASQQIALASKSSVISNSALAVALMAEASQIRPFIAAAVALGENVVNVFCGNQSPLLEAEPAQWVGPNELASNLAPSCVIPTLCRCTSLPVLPLRMFRTACSTTHDSGAAWLCATFPWRVWTHRRDSDRRSPLRRSVDRRLEAMRPEYDDPASHVTAMESMETSDVPSPDHATSSERVA